jgi:hypothetical protein
MFSIVILSPTFLRNSWAPEQMEWLYERTLSGKTVILLVVHDFSSDKIQSLRKELRWRKTPAKHLEYLVELSEGSTENGIQLLAKKLAERIRRWHE